METPSYKKRIWIATVPAGRWSQGPMVINDFGKETEETLEQLRKERYTIDGPYVLEQQPRPVHKQTAEEFQERMIHIHGNEDGA